MASNKPFKLSTVIATVVAASAIAAALTGCNTTNNNTIYASNEHSITASASAEVKVTPDKAQINIGVVATGTDAATVQEQGTEQANAVVAALQAQGIADKSIRTEYVSLSPTYDYEKGAAEPNGYQMNIMLTVTDLDIADVGAVVETAVNAGAGRIDSLRYYASNYDEAYAKALNDAIAASRDKADSMAKAAGVRIGGVVNITEGYQDTSARYTYAAAEAVYDSGTGVNGMAKNARAMPGELTITAYVTATYTIE